MPARVHGRVDAFAPGSDTAFELGGLQAPIDDVACRFVSGCGERGEVGGAVARCFVEDGVDSLSFGEEVGGAPHLQWCRGDAVEDELLVAAPFEAGGERVERVVRADRGGVGAVPHLRFDKPLRASRHFSLTIQDSGLMCIAVLAFRRRG